MITNISEQIKNDGLPIEGIGPWSAEKYKLIQHYVSQFATSMKNKWKSRIYIDLFASCGVSKIKGTSKIVPASPLLAMNIKDPFDRYIFCDIDGDKLNALKERTKRLFPHLFTAFVIGDVNKNVDQILRHIPKASRSHTVLTFCLVDPYNLGNLQFNTIKTLSTNYYMDFLILIPTYMDAKRNWLNYLSPGNPTIDRFLGDFNWKSSWKQEMKKGTKFGRFLVFKFCEQMSKLDFLIPDASDIILMKIKDRNVSLYHLAFFSRHPLGMRFWKNAIKGTSTQLSLF